jgi:predicted nucleic acid-binding protein
MISITLDTGALIALERGAKRIRALLLGMKEQHAVVTVPAVVLAEWWRTDSKRNRLLLSGFTIEPTTARLARIAGEAMAEVPAATAIDAIVMTSAAQRGDTVFTSDIDDLERLRACFPSVRVLRA